MAVKLGLIGAGGVARGHLKHIDELGDRVTLVAAADVDPERARSAAEPRGAKTFKTGEELLAGAEVDALLICIPPFAHGDLEAKIAEAGKHVLVEKPVGLDLDRARKNAEALEKAGVVAAAAYHFRHMEGMAKARELLAGRKIALVTGQWIGGCPGTPWWRVKAECGGQHAEQTTHIFDLARFLAGEVESVAAAKSAGGILTGVMDNYDVEEATSAQLAFVGGAIGHIASANVVKKGGGVSLTVFAEGATVHVTGGKLKIMTPDCETVEEIGGGANPKMAELVEFLDAVEKGDPSAVKSTFTDAVRTLAVTDAMDRAIESGGRVKVA